VTSGHVAVRGLRAGYGETTILDIDELEVRAGEFLSVLGPSGCGKTTLLNVIAGFVEPTAGTVLIDGQDVTHTPPYRRNLGLVFQSYALFPHMTVAQNLSYGMKVRGAGKAAQATRVAEVLDLVGLSEYAGRMPRQLSGGQQQRVALARALAYSPTVLLLDEPLSNLDAKLRRQMQSELRQIQRRVGTTMIFVTHDQDEALTMADRVALLNGGHIEQIGSPQDIYRSPRTPFVADFLGAGNLLRATVVDPHTVVSNGTSLPVTTDCPVGTEVTVVLRREQLRLASTAVADQGPRGEVTFRAFSGGTWHVQVRLLADHAEATRVPGQVISVELPDTGRSGAPAEEGAVVRLTWGADSVVVIQE
jgi:putative spermidine/putrescine transport system ATP-binding protein